jgi:hypothetical protein
VERIHAESRRLKQRAESYALDQARLHTALRRLKERLAEAWVAKQVEIKDLRPADDKTPAPVPPTERSTMSPREKVRLPSAPHHWPGGAERFARFLERLAENPHVTRVAPRNFSGPPRQGPEFVTEEGDVLVRITDGDVTAHVLVLTTAADRAQGEFVREALASVFSSTSL